MSRSQRDRQRYQGVDDNSLRSHQNYASYSSRDPTAYRRDRTHHNGAQSASAPQVPTYDPSHDPQYTSAMRSLAYDSFLRYDANRHNGPYDAVGYIRRDGDVYDNDEVYEEYRTHDPRMQNRVPVRGYYSSDGLSYGVGGSGARGLSSKTLKNVSEKTEMNEQCSSTSPISSGNNEQNQPKLPAVTGDGKDKIHLRKEDNVPISPQLDDDIEVRSLRAVPAEDGMADPAISVILNDAELQYDLDMRRHQSEDVSYRLHSASRRGEKYDDRYPRSSSYIDSLDLAGTLRVRRWLTEAGKHLGDAAHEKLDMTGGEMRPLVIDELAWNPTSSPLFPEASDGNLRKLNPAGVSRTYIKRRDTLEVPKDARFSRSQSLRDNISPSERHPAHSAFVITKAERPVPATDQLVPPMLPYDVPPHLQPPDYDLEGSGDVNTVDDTNELVGDSNKNSVLKDGENMPVLPSYVALVAPASTESPSTSASGLPRGNSYSAAEIAEATRLLLLVLYKKRWFLPLCQSALENQEIGLGRLQKNLLRFLLACAALLHSKAAQSKKRVGYLAARLLYAKSAFLAQYIVRTLLSNRGTAQSPQYKYDNGSPDEEDDSYFIPYSIEKVFPNEAFRRFMENDVDYDAKNDTEPIMEHDVEDDMEDNVENDVGSDGIELGPFKQDLHALVDFLGESKAFDVLREGLITLVINPLRVGQADPVIGIALGRNKTVSENDVSKLSAQFKTTLTWHEWFQGDRQVSSSASHSGAYHYLSTAIRSHLNPDAFPHAIDHILVAMGLLEPALDKNKTRLRWRCHCGDSLHSDILEIREGGIAALVDNMEQSSGVKVHAAPYNHQAGNRQYIVPRPDRWLRNAATKVGSALGRSWRSFSKRLPQHNEPCGTCATTPCASSNNLPPQQKTLHLSMCMDRTRRRTIVHQDRVDSFKTDRQLLCFLQKQYTAHSSRFPNLLRLKSVEKIVFVKYLLPMNGIVDVQRCNSTRPNQKHCYCIPPPKKVGVEYDYRPSPPKTHPPISPEYLASWFTCMKDIPKVDKDQECWILNRLPKRTCGVLEGRKEDPAEGWGIYFVEGWDRATITLTIFVIFLVASLLFGVLWWKFQFDIQGGFGVSAYMGTVCTLLIAVIVTQLENKE